MKTEVTVSPDGKACWIGPPHPGLHHNMRMLCDALEEYKAQLTKDKGDICEEDPDLTTCTMMLITASIGWHWPIAAIKALRR